ncbi:nucleoside triphosphate pyrophosphohydrolase [Seohaeicola sp. SP36]|uniref:nucleoside triphosphate pyrophosphohydrolase n=1 Tax=unclassified Seohaeicola TaxID=2641111 RepID=UPI00237A0930|nr:MULTISPECIES: nucleoside triphosphate pyrophosphohydrolase [unclassified Seohaeicola]MDD9709819.1 nucleoside triphosphate pyrophosphohydrolase [Seohaeicola sp. 4SK31]MDD9738068.1 nucleoside triphosphate pyrophosphohydrolase [Seohaeicola sp. SP36]
MTTGKLVRDRIPEIIEANGRNPVVKQLRGEALLSALYDKLDEERAEFITAEGVEAKCEELADMVEVIIALASYHGCDEIALMEILAHKRETRGGFREGLFYEGDD